MTTLEITPKTADKTARFKGTVAAGEHVAVTIKGGASWIGDDAGANLSLRVLDLVTGRTLAVFPRPEETLGEGEVPDAWGSSGDDLTCTLNLNTDRMVAAARHMLRVPVMFVLGDTDSPRTLYFRDRCEVEYWPERIGDDTPYDLDKWPKKIDEWTELVAEWEERLSGFSSTLASHVDDAVRHITANERTLWNGKASQMDLNTEATARSVADANEARERAAADGELQANKADRATTYTKTEVDAIVAALKSGSRQIVQSLPQSGDPMVIYMVPKASAKANNGYDEYIWTASGAWEKIGDTEIDLSGYAKSSQLADVAKSGSYNDLHDKPTIPAAVTVDAALDGASANPVQNRAVKEAIDARPTKEAVEAGWQTAWTILREGVDVTAKLAQPRYVGDENEDMWSLEGCWLPGETLDSAEEVFAPRDVAELSWTTTDENVATTAHYTATRRRVAGPVPTKTSELENDGSDGEHPYASRADVALSPMYGEGRWTYTGLPAGWTVLAAAPTYAAGEWTVDVFNDDEGQLTAWNAELADPAATDIELLVEPAEYPSFSFRAVLSRPVVGYTLPGQETMPLQPKGDYLTEHQDISGKANVSDVPLWAAKEAAKLASAWTYSDPDLGDDEIYTEPVWTNDVWTIHLARYSAILKTFVQVSGTWTVQGQSDAAMLTFSVEGVNIIFTRKSANVTELAHLSDMPDTSGKEDRYQFAAATVENGVIVLQDAKVQMLEVLQSGEAFTVSPPSGTSATARDAVLVIDCTSLTEGQEPTVTWPAAFHPRTDAGTDFACVAGAKNVYYISEYSPGEFAVGGWTETTGGSGT